MSGQPAERDARQDVIESARTAHVWTIRDGRAIRPDLYQDRSRALKAVGLEG
jgi:hypothetical protein